MSIALLVVIIENLKTLNYHKFLKTISSSYYLQKCDNEGENIFKEE